MAIRRLTADILGKIMEHMEPTDCGNLRDACKPLERKADIARIFKTVQLWTTPDRIDQIWVLDVLRRMVSIPEGAACVKVVDLSHHCGNVNPAQGATRRDAQQWLSSSVHFLEQLDNANSWWSQGRWTTASELRRYIGDCDVCCGLVPFLLTALPNLQTLLLHGHRVQHNFLAFLYAIGQGLAPATQFSSLQRVDFDAAGHGSDLVLVRAVLSLPALRTLTIRGAEDILSPRPARYSPVTQLYLVDCSVTARSLGSLLEAMPHLEVLYSSTSVHWANHNPPRHRMEPPNAWLETVAAYCGGTLKELRLDDKDRGWIGVGVTVPDFRPLRCLQKLECSILLVLNSVVCLQYILPKSIEQVKLLRQSDTSSRWPSIQRLFDDWRWTRPTSVPSLRDVIVDNHFVITEMEVEQWRDFQRLGNVTLGAGFGWQDLVVWPTMTGYEEPLNSGAEPMQTD